MTLIYRSFFSVLTFLVFLFGVGASVVHAIPAGPNPSGTSVSTTVPFNAGDGEFQLDAEVSFDPSAGMWIKRIPVGEDFPNGMIIDDSVTLTERITIGSNQPLWTDWHEIILTDFFTWGDYEIGTVDGSGAVTPLIHEVLQVGAEISFFFDPLTPGTVLEISKEIIYLDNPDPTQGEIFTGVIEIAQYPTIDEPAAMMIFGFGLVALGLARRRRTRRTA